MIIRLTEGESGGRYDGRQWPGPGIDFEVPDSEGQALIEHGRAEVVKPPKPPKNGTPKPPSLRDLLEGDDAGDAGEKG